MSLKRCVLVVDDSVDGREMLVEYLAFRQFQVAAAQHGEEAIEVARRIRPAVILMDLSMPGMDGWEATRRLKADPVTKDAVIVAVTAHAFPPEQASARAAGCDAVIAKPFNLAALADAIHRILSTGVAGLDAKSVTASVARRYARHGLSSISGDPTKRA
jgi:two-component system cell cycle response regulator DivK